MIVLPFTAQGTICAFPYCAILRQVKSSLQSCQKLRWANMRDKNRVPKEALAICRFLLIFFFCIECSSVQPAPILIQSSEVDNELKTISVHVIDKPGQSWLGNGVYMGNGFILTAAHVVGSSWFTKPTVEVGQLSLPADIVREGSFANDDLTLLRVDDTKLPMIVRLRHVQLCETIPALGSPLIVATPEGTKRSILISPVALSPHLRALFPTLIPDVATTGNSGSGVYEAASQCLLGIMSRKISAVAYQMHDGVRTKVLHDIAKYFVPSPVISRALPSWISY